MILSNGHPKTGTHALNKTIQLLGVPSQVVHFPYSEKPEEKSVCIFRNPKNVIISWLRFTGKPVTQGMIIEQIKNHAERGILESCSDYTPYLDTDVLCVRYEELLTDEGETVEKIAKYLDVPVLEDCYPNIQGMTVTWTGEPSNWEDHWSDEIQKAWDENGGPELEAAWKY